MIDSQKLQQLLYPSVRTWADPTGLDNKLRVPGLVKDRLNDSVRRQRVVTKGLSSMKEGIHPNYEEVEVTCGCGNKFTTRATATNLKVDICNVCHPFYTGKMKHIDREGRIDRFKNRFSSGYNSLNTKKRRTPKKKMAEE